MTLRLKMKHAPVTGPLPRYRSSGEEPKDQSKVPNCPHCKVPMMWYESHLKRQNGSSKVVHSFSCPECARVIQIEEPYKIALRVV